MSAPSKKLVIGVDGGGTKTCVWLGRVDADQANGPRLSVLGKATTGPGNVRAAGFDVALQNVRDAIMQAFAAAGIHPARVAQACISLAGAGRAAEQTRISRWAEQNSIADEVRVLGDAEAVLAAAAEPEDWRNPLVGISLIAGTGSMVWGQNASGKQARSGGWGYLLGDEGSAYDIGLQALQLACRTADGRKSANEFCRQLLAHLRLESSRQLIGWCYEIGNERERIASLAPFVCSLQQQDEFAQQILRNGSQSLAELVATVGRKLGFPAGQYQLACAGSVLLKQADYLAAVLQELNDRNFSPSKCQTIQDPVSGALRMAAFG